MIQIKQFLLDNWYNLMLAISNFSTFLLTRRFTISTNNNESLKHQLQNIYKPLVVYLKYHNIYDMNEIKHFYDYFHSIIVENYEYIPSDLLAYEGSLLLSIETLKFIDANNICNNINKYCVSKYNVICYKLNLPSASIKGANLLLSRSDKIKILLLKLLDPWFLLLSFHICLLNICDLITTIFFDFSFARLIYSNLISFLFSFIPAIIIFLILRYRK